MESTIVSWLVTEGHNGTGETPVVKDFDEHDIASIPMPFGASVEVLNSVAIDDFNHMGFNPLQADSRPA